jgi:hypothetical protein
MMRKGALIFAVFLASLAALAGCGGGDSSLSDKEFHQQLNLVCNHGSREEEEVYGQLAKEYHERETKITAQVAAANVLQLVASYQRTTEAIADIGLPEGKSAKKQAEALIQLREEAAKTIQKDPVHRERLAVIFKKPNERAMALGVQGCVF